MSGQRLKIYLDSTSLPLVQQMADFVACAQSPDVIKVVTWLRLPMDPAQLRRYSAVYSAQRAAVHPDFVRQLCDNVRKHRYPHIELHTNQFQAWRGALPLLRELAPLADSLGSELKLELYDDGTIGPLQREQLKTCHDPQGRLAEAGAELRSAVYDKAALQWSVPHSYAWQSVLPTRYHLLRRDILRRNDEGSALAAALEPHSTDMRFEGLPDLTDDQRMLYLQLFGLDAEIGDRLGALAARDDAIVFTASATRIRKDNRALRDSQLKGIAQLREHGIFDSLGAIGYKSHPANLEYDNDLIAALGEGTVVLPPRVPMEVLMMAGLLPWSVGGVASSSYFTLGPERIAFMLCKRSALEPGGADSAMLNLMLECGVVDPSRVLPLLD